MAVKIGHASIDENGKIIGGQAGDQTGKEVCTRTWYDKDWKMVLRPRESKLAEESARACEQACANKNIGYDQANRNSLNQEAKKTQYDLSEIEKKCECDCSSLMTVCAIAGGAKIPYTGNAPTTATMQKEFMATGEYECLTDSKYLTSDKYLKRGDILVKPNSHTVMVLENGSAVSGASIKPTKADSAKSFDKKVAGKYTVTASVLNMRSGAGITKPVIGKLPHGTKVQCFGYYTALDGVKWLYIQTADGKIGFVSSKYLKK